MPVLKVPLIKHLYTCNRLIFKQPLKNLLQICIKHKKLYLNACLIVLDYPIR